MTYKCLKLKLRVFLAGHIVAMVTYCATKLTATYSPMIGQFVDTMILASTDKDVVIMIHQTVSLGKYCKLFPSTLSNRGFPGDGDTTGRKSLGRGCRCSRQNV